MTAAAPLEPATTSATPLAEREAAWTASLRAQRRLAGPVPATIAVLAAALVTIVWVTSAGDPSASLAPALLVVVVAWAHAGYRTVTGSRGVRELGRAALLTRPRQLEPADAARLSSWQLEPIDARSLGQLDRILRLDPAELPKDSPFVSRAARVSSTVLVLVVILTSWAGGLLAIVSLVGLVLGDRFENGPGTWMLLGVLLIGLSSADGAIIRAMGELLRVERARAIRTAQELLDADVFPDDGSELAVIVRENGRLVARPDRLRRGIRPLPRHFAATPDGFPGRSVVDLVFAWVAPVVVLFVVLVSTLITDAPI